MLKRVSLVLLSASLLATPAMVHAEASLHGFGDLSIKNDYITPRGLRVTSEGETVQALGGLVIDMPPKPGGTITDFSVSAGTWMDFNPHFKAPNTQTLNEVDWFVGANVKLGQDWKAGAQYVEFISAPGAFNTEKNLELSLAFDDSKYLKPVSLQPYVKVFYAMDGDSTVVLGKKGGTYDVEVGATPSLNLKPVILSMPTWVTLGPKSYFGGGGTVGVVSTGLKVSYPLATVPKSAGSWTLYAGYQYYHLANKKLVQAQSLLNPGKSDKDLNLFQAGVSLGF